MLTVRPLCESERRSREVSEGVVLDYDEDGNLIGIDINNASKKLDCPRLLRALHISCRTSFEPHNLIPQHFLVSSRPRARG